MTVQHTAGPWDVEDPMDHELWIVEAGRKAYQWRVIAGLPWPDETGDIAKAQVSANARLIASAPELLEALKQAHYEAVQSDGVILRDTAAKMAAAIAKATGE